MDFSKVQELISNPRLVTYSRSLGIESEDLLAAYAWHLNVVSNFYPLVQLIEVALRNAINNQGLQAYSATPWFDALPSKSEIDQDGNLKDTEMVGKFKENVKSAKKKAKKILKDKGLDVEPNIDQIIAQTDFSTWEYILDKGFYDGGNNSFLWPSRFYKVFTKPPRYEGTNPMFHQRDIIRRRIEEVRNFRNRLSHNEPIWRVSEVNCSEDVFGYLEEKYKKIMQLAYWISPQLKLFIVKMGFDSRIRLCLTNHELRRFLAKIEISQIRKIEDFAGLVQDMHTTNRVVSFKYEESAGLILPTHV